MIVTERLTFSTLIGDGVIIYKAAVQQNIIYRSVPRPLLYYESHEN